MAPGDAASERWPLRARRETRVLDRLPWIGELAGGAGAAVFASALLLVVVSVVFGGASQTNALSLTAVELASLPLLFLCAYQFLTAGPPPGAGAPLVLLAAVVAIPLLQLVPLPPDLWMRLPGHAPVAPALDAARLGRPALPLSLAPEETWRALLALTPPAAMLLGALALSEAQRRVLVGLWLMLGVVSLLVGALQMLGGDSSPLYFYSITNRGSAVGLFANRNHQAAFLYALAPLAGAFASAFRGEVSDRRSLPALLAILYISLAIIGVAVTRSRAGVVLMGLALFAALAVALRGGAFRRHWRAALSLGAGAAIGVVAVLLFGLTPILDRFSHGASGDLRFDGWPIVLHAAGGVLPFGAGIGAFNRVYTAAEPLSQVSRVYFNHAHNDYLELWLETGVVGALVFAAFAAWFAVRATAVWITRPGRRPATALSAAASLSIGLLLAHSFVDYPLRTESLAVLFAFACGALARGRSPRSPGASKAVASPAVAAD